MAIAELNFEDKECKKANPDQELIEMALEKIKLDNQIENLFQELRETGEDEEEFLAKVDPLRDASINLTKKASKIVPEGYAGVVALLTMVGSDGEAREDARSDDWVENILGTITLYALNLVQDVKPHPIARVDLLSDQTDLEDVKDYYLITIDDFDKGYQLPCDEHRIEDAHEHARKLEEKFLGSSYCKN